jgi:hypothetical protein
MLAKSLFRKKCERQLACGPSRHFCYVGGDDPDTWYCGGFYHSRRFRCHRTVRLHLLSDDVYRCIQWGQWSPSQMWLQQRVETVFSKLWGASAHGHILKMRCFTIGIYYGTVGYDTAYSSKSIPTFRIQYVPWKRWYPHTRLLAITNQQAQYECSPWKLHILYT